MGFTKANKVGEIALVLVYKMHTDEKGQPIEFKYVMRKVRDGEAQESKAEQALGAKSELDQFADLLVDLSGFEDFPAGDRAIGERAKEYFADDDMAYFYRDALAAYWGTVYPRQLFRTS